MSYTALLCIFTSIFAVPIPNVPNLNRPSFNTGTFIIINPYIYLQDAIDELDYRNNCVEKLRKNQRMNTLKCKQYDVRRHKERARISERNLTYNTGERRLID